MSQGERDFRLAEAAVAEAMRHHGTIDPDHLESEVRYVAMTAVAFAMGKMRTSQMAATTHLCETPAVEWR